jgi:nitrogen fixation NifU-like protein
MHEELYKQHILDHYNRPRNKVVVKDATYVAKGSNPSCGDVLIMYVQVDGDSITRCTFDGIGCAISQAAASILTEKLTNMSVESARALTETDIYAMLGIEISLARRKCALLAYNALQSALTSNL